MSINLVKCNNLGDALAHINQEHVTANWIYRGQTYRRHVHRFVEDGKEHIFENLYPQSFRFAAEYEELSGDFDKHWREEYIRTEAIFNAFISFLLLSYEKHKDAESQRFGWMKPYADEFERLFSGPGPSLFSGFHSREMGLKNPEFIRLCWALAQHYGVVTALLDLTYEPQVAAWFATNLWDKPQQALQLQGEAIIYRFQIEDLAAAIETYNRVFAQQEDNIFKAPADSAFIQDLRIIPKAFASRPSCQEALVVSGFDALMLLRLINGKGKIDAFIFPHTPDQQTRWPLNVSREYLIPEDDPFLEFKTEFEEKWKPLVGEISAAHYTKPVMILTDDGPKFANITSEEDDPFRDMAREQLYAAGMKELGGNLQSAQRVFEQVIHLNAGENYDRLSSFAFVRVAVIQFMNENLKASCEALANSLTGTEQQPQAEWVAELLPTIAQGAEMLLRKGATGLLPIFERLVAVSKLAKQVPQIIEVGLGAKMFVGAIEDALGNTQAAEIVLEEVARTELDKLTPEQRAFVAEAQIRLAMILLQQGEEQRAKAIYAGVAKQFANDTLGKTSQLVAIARANL